MSMTNSTNGTMVTKEDEFRDILNTVHSTGSSIAVVYLALIIAVIWKLGLYKTYPAFTLRWTLYLELWFNIVTCVTWSEFSPLHQVLLINPTAASCYFSVFNDTFCAAGVIYLSVIAAHALSRITASRRRVVHKARHTLLVKLMFFVITIGLGFMSASGVYVIAGTCSVKSKVTIAIKRYVLSAFFLAQILLVVQLICNIIVSNNTITSSKSKCAGCTAIPSSHATLALRFVVILVTQALSWFPMLSLEYQANFNSGVPTYFVLFSAYGTSIGPIIDGTCLLWNKKIRRWAKAKATLFNRTRAFVIPEFEERTSSKRTHQQSC